jgi:8-oxo-dGTP pyrophosphatase MutT (NUDIX family)
VSLVSGKTWLPIGSILRNEEPVDGAVRELLEETGLTLTVLDDLKLLSNNPVRVQLPYGKHQLGYVFLRHPLRFSTLLRFRSSCARRAEVGDVTQMFA